MKNLKLIGFLVIVASSLLFIQCTSDTIAGPQGVAGIDGVNGADGVDGVDGIDGVNGTATCVACHTNSHREPIKASFALSSHADQTIMYDGSLLSDYAGAGSNRTSCNRCHSNEGYVNYITGKPAVALETPTGISCNTCHDQHSTFDFENDGYDYALRNLAPVTLDLTDASYTIDYADASNNCVSCHQPRSKAPVDEDNDGLYLQANSRFYPHYGGQSTMLEGIQGAIIANGTTAYPGVGTAGHRTGASCTSCHMGDSSDGLTGLHTYKPSFSATICTTCHTTVPTEVTGLAANMATLHNKLFDLGLITENGSTIKQTELIPFKTAQALWNYKTVEEDRSNGVHNPKYATALIKNALEVLE
tara:strand:- start:7276 stop:8358 length:1083 start_codon:yes stop_codon:yes gene_type:complete